MKKTTFLIIVALMLASASTVIVPHGASQPESIKILDYSHYMIYYPETVLIVVGEAQNTGSNIIDKLTVAGTFYDPDGELYMYNYATALTFQIEPQQKTPFYIMFTPNHIVGNPSWQTSEVTNFTITAISAPTTTTQQYKGLEIISHSGGTDEYGYYRVTGVLKNTGTQPANRTWIVATFYNSTGTPVAVGYTEYLTSTPIQPGETVSFTVYPLDAEIVSPYISSYALIPQIKVTSTPSTTATPTTSPSTSPTPTIPGATSTTSTPTGNGTTPMPETYLYIAIAIVIIAIAVVALVLKKRAGKHSENTKKAK